MSNVRPVEERHARLYLHLAERFGWTPAQINELDPSVRVAMAKVLNLSPSDDAPTEDDKQAADGAPAEPEGLADWERELLERSSAEAAKDAPGVTTTAPNVIEVHVHLDGKAIYDAILPRIEAERVRQRLLNGNWTLT